MVASSLPTLETEGEVAKVVDSPSECSSCSKGSGRNSFHVKNPHEATPHNGHGGRTAPGPHLAG
jgi:hypothetical protein